MINVFHLHVGGNDPVPWGEFTTVPDSPHDIADELIVPLLTESGHNHLLVEDDGYVGVKIPSFDDADLDLMVEATAAEATVWTTSLFHENYDAEDGNHVGMAMGLIRDLLQGKARIRERRAGDFPYRADLERRGTEGWQWSQSVVVPLFPYFSRRTESLYTWETGT